MSERPASQEATLLENLTVDEVSLVDRAANGRRFLVWKNHQRGTPMKDTLNAVAEVATEREADLIEAVAKLDLSEDAQAALTTAHRILVGFADEIPAEALSAFGLAGAPAEVAKDEPEADAEEPEAAAIEDEPAEVEKAADELDPVLKAANDRIAELEAVLKAERDERVLKADTESIADRFGALPGVKADELAPVWGELRKAAPDALKVIEDTFGRLTAASVAKAEGLLSETGKTTAVEAAGSAWDRIEQLAQDRVRKGLDENKAKAIDTVLKTEPKLYGEYLAERTK